MTSWPWMGGRPSAQRRPSGSAGGRVGSHVGERLRRRCHQGSTCPDVLLDTPSRPTQAALGGGAGQRQGKTRRVGVQTVSTTGQTRALCTHGLLGVPAALAGEDVPALGTLSIPRKGRPRSLTRKSQWWREVSLKLELAAAVPSPHLAPLNLQCWPL